MDKFLLKRNAPSQPEDINWEEEIQYDQGNRLNDESLSDDIICYVEKEEMKRVNNAQMVEYFMAWMDRNILR